ncbi:MAG TPA: pantoate--beta-alanine ligase [Gemmatimonadaceae bacterium]|nr:pantoate--beta-alanine ligase [Gemmatimonadaceae bacterium]
MRTIESVAKMISAAAKIRKDGERIAYVPTMGALHEGHLTLLDEAARRGDKVVLSVFVNSLQFGPGEDYQRYPRTLEEDVKLAKSRGADIVFAPTSEEMYSLTPMVTVNPGVLAKEWEGSARPNHFQGVLTVVAKLFHIVQPAVAVFGQKDLQQAAIVRAMVRDLNFPVEIVSCPIVREPDGLAMSSRNRFLAPKEREVALMLSKALFALRDAFTKGERRASALEAIGWRMLERVQGLTPRYLAVVNANTFLRVNLVSPGDAAIGAIRVGETRLIDNIIF